MIIKTVWYWEKSCQKPQYNRIENPEIDSHPFLQLYFHEDQHNVARKESLLLTGRNRK